MSKPLVSLRAELQEKLGGLASRAVGCDSTEVTDCAHYLIPDSDGEAPRRYPFICAPTEWQIRLVAQAILAVPAAVQMIAEWNALVSPDKDHLRYLRSAAED